MFGLKDTLTNRVKTATTFDSLFSEPVARTDTPKQINSAEHIPTPRTFSSGATTDRGRYGLDTLQHEMLQGVDVLTKPAGTEPLGLGEHPDTQAAASDFIRKRHG